MILAGDAGGTHTRLGLFEVREGTLAPVASAVFESREHASLEAIVARFVAGASGRAAHACFGVPGPVAGGRAAPTNLPWAVDAARLEAALDGCRVWLVNDLEAGAHGIAALGPADLAELQPGQPESRGNGAVISAGTGLGQAGLVWDGRRHHPFPSEGGHADFAPTGDEQVALWRFLAEELGGHVSVERVVSGPGLHNVYRFLRDTGRAEEPAWLAEALRGQDPGPAISAYALEGGPELCVRALDLLIAVYGAAAGNLALTVMARGGVYLGGGIAPRILPRLRAGGFVEAFCAKGRLRPLLAAMPVRVILDDRAGLLGAARCAALRAGLL